MTRLPLYRPCVDASEHVLCGREAGWRLESIDMDAHYEVPPATLEAVPQFATSHSNALVAIATRM